MESEAISGQVGNAEETRREEMLGKSKPAAYGQKIARGPCTLALGGGARIRHSDGGVPVW